MKNKSRNSTTISNYLRHKNKSNEAFEHMVNALTIEELLALKIELATKTSNTPLVFMPLFKNCNHIIRECLGLVAVIMAGNIQGAAEILGISNTRMEAIARKYSILEKVNYYNAVANDDKNDFFN